MSARGRAALAWACGLLGCGAVPADPVVQAPINRCDDDAGCALGATCSEAGRCEIDDASEFVLVVPQSTSAEYAPGVTYVLTSKLLRDGRVDELACPSGDCFSLPRITVLTGRYLLGQAVASELGVGSDVAVAQAPLQARYRLLWPSYDGALWRDARELGLPIDEVLAQRVPTDSDAQPGLAGLPALTVSASLGPGSYTVSYLPEASLQQALPPWISRRAIEAGGRTQRLSYDLALLGAPGLGLDPAGVTTATLGSRARTLSGFRAYLSDRNSGAVVSRVAELQGESTRVNLSTVQQTDENGRLPSTLQLVIDPPAGALAVPQLVAPIISHALNDQLYPELPSPSRVVAQVLDDQGQPAAARVALVSTRVASLRQAVPEDQLRYDTWLETDAEGRLQTLLPEGQYDLFVDPLDERLARRRLTLSTAGYGVGSGYGSTSEWSVRLEPRSSVQGHAALPNGAPLSGAVVRAVPSVPRHVLHSLERPRPAEAFADEAGAFTLALDAGYYDVTLEAPSGSGFAPLVITGLFVPRADRVFVDDDPSDAHCGLVRLRYPGAHRSERAADGQPRSLSLRDPLESPQPWTWVRVFGWTEERSRYVELGRELTDGQGRVELLFAAPVAAPPLPVRCP